MTDASNTPSYEALRETIRSLPSAASGEERVVVHLDPEGSLAVARDPEGKVELFLVGPQMDARQPAVRERLVHNTWMTADDHPFAANRIVLPPGHHLDAAAALICAELLANDYPSSPSDAFARSEPVIDLVLTPAHQADRTLTGLAGELTFLSALLDAQQGGEAESLVAAWHGWRPSSRDFQLGSVGVEVKTSTTGSSTHHIQGWYQVEPGTAADGTAETSLYLLSLGIRWLQHGKAGLSIEALTAKVAGRLEAQARAKFHEQVRRYGGMLLELDASGSAAQKALRRPFMVVYERLYDMADQRILLPRSADLMPFSHVLPDTMEFVIRLPEKVRGDRNPITGLENIAHHVHAMSTRA